MSCFGPNFTNSFRELLLMKFTRKYMINLLEVQLFAICQVAAKFDGANFRSPGKLTRFIGLVEDTATLCKNYIKKLLQ